MDGKAKAMRELVEREISGGERRWMGWKVEGRCRKRGEAVGVGSEGWKGWRDRGR